ncbi:MAG: hypothetical protein FJ225_07260, partial [Lentisphaerae bacterium]|nr:hypothetical protein [Lentisphaerota bacterium]
MQFTQFAGLIPSTVGTPSDGYFAGGGGGGATGTEGTTCGSGGLGGGGNGLFGGSTAGTGTASNGLANTGGGGGGAPDNNNTGHGGKGGSGIVIVRYINPAIGLVNSNATSVTATSALFNATLTLTGSNSTWDVYAYWGPADGTNNPSAWSNTAFAGTYTLNTTSTNIAYPASSGIVAGTTYYTF